MSYPAIMTERYQLSLSAYFKRLLRVSSAYASVKIVSGPRKGTDLGETECIPNSFNPDWCKVFFLDFDPDDNTALEITIWDFQHGSAPWRVGGARLNAAEVYRKKGAQAKIGTKGASLLFCTIEKSMFGTEKGDLTVHVRGLDMKNQEPGPFGLGRSDPFYEISRKNSSQKNKEIAWNAIYRSKVITNILNPMWAPAHLGLQELCYGDLTWPIKVSVYDYNKRGSHTLMGECITSVQDLQKHLSIRGNADRVQALAIKKEIEGVSLITGWVCILEASIGPASEKKNTYVSHNRQPAKCSWVLIFLVILIVVVLPAVLATTLAPSDDEPLSTTPASTRDSYYNDYLRDLTMTLNGTNVGYFAYLHALDPQSKALNWLMKDDTGSNITTTDPAILLERYAMACLYFSTNGDTWTQETNFLSNASVCDWNGNWGDSVRCSPAQQVIDISLYDKGVSGSLPAELALLFNLNGMWLSKNDITGRLPTRLGLLSNLKNLYVGQNNLSGKIPAEIASLKSLRNLHVQNNPLLTGNLEELCSIVDHRSFYGAADCLHGNVVCSCCDLCL